MLFINPAPVMPAPEQVPVVVLTPPPPAPPEQKSPPAPQVIFDAMVPPAEPVPPACPALAVQIPVEAHNKVPDVTTVSAAPPVAPPEEPTTPPAATTTPDFRTLSCVLFVGCFEIK